MSDYGIFIAARGESMETGKLNYDSRKSHLLVDLLATPKHMDIIDNMSGGTAFVSNAVSTSDQIEILRAIPHGKTYTPEVLVYLYAKSYNGSTTDPKAGLYGIGSLFYGAGGFITDTLFASVDATNLYIKHELDNSLVPQAYTSDADKYVIRVKYYILSNDSHVSAYSLRGY